MARKSLLARVEEPARLVIQLMEAFNRHDVPGIMALFSDDCLFESPFPAPDGGIYRGREAVTQYWQNFFTRVIEDAKKAAYETASSATRNLQKIDPDSPPPGFVPLYESFFGQYSPGNLRQVRVSAR